MTAATRSRRFLQTLLIGTSLVAAACVTINVYFPEAAVKDLSQQIEEAVAKAAAQGSAGAEAPVEEDSPEGGDSTSLSATAARAVVGTLLWLSAPEAHAQGEEVAAPEISSPAIRAIVRSRAERLEEIRGHKSAGHLGESNQALLVARSLDSLELRDRAAVQRLIKAENQDRERMFKEIAAATGTDLSALPQIQATYAETLRENAKTGDWIQLPGGEWRQKS